FALHSSIYSQLDRSKCGFPGRRIRVAFRRVAMTALCVRGLARLRPLFWLAAILPPPVAASRASAPDAIVVRLDSARVVKLPERGTTLVIGNPLIADLTLQPGNLAVITAKSFGATNVVVRDKSGPVLNEQTIEVLGPADPTVVVYRGVDRETY